MDSVSPPILQSPSSSLANVSSSEMASVSNLNRRRNRSISFEGDNENADTAKDSSESLPKDFESIDTAPAEMKNVLSWSLNLSTREANEEFKDYLRSEARSRAKILAIIKLLITVFISIASFTSMEEKLKDQQQDITGKYLTELLCIFMGLATLIMCLILFLSSRKKVYAELFIPAELTGFLIAFVAIFVFSDCTELERVQIWVSIMLIVALNLISMMLFVTASWLTGFILRQSTHIVFWVYAYAVRLGQKPVGETIQSFVFLISLVAIMEIAIYMQVRSKAILFQSLKQSEM